MAGQGMVRREFMRTLAIAAAASSFPGFVRWSFACAGTHTETPNPSSNVSLYRPQFFTVAEFALLDCLAELIIPSDEHPGAHAAGVAEFIDFMLANGGSLSAVSVIGSAGKAKHRPLVGDPQIPRADTEPQEIFRSGLNWIDQRSQSLYGKRFLECPEPQQSDLLRHLAYRKYFRAGEEFGRHFFQLLRDYTVKSYYTSRIGLEALGYPGLQTMWASMPGCPHTNDPEHKHLPPPIV
jgi:gluconate 2-dehydrogenase gamma chain